MTSDGIPYRELETIFLDVGNTLVSMDFEWILRELEERGVVTDLESLGRAEAASRPLVSEALSSRGSTEGSSVFAFYLGSILAKLGLAAESIPGIVDDLVPVLRRPGRDKLWSRVLPGVRGALDKLRALGLRLAVVSNSDGTVEKVLTRQGLRPYVDAVFDSHLVGFEKPDPRIFRHALETTGACARTTLHVGDLYAADVEGARAAGVHAALLDPFGDWSHADCPRFADLKALSETIERARVLS